jgi:ribonuclease HI
VGDFNLHHPLWSRPGYEHIHPEADELLDIAMDHELTQQLPRGTTTYEKRVDGETQRTTIDLVWATHRLSDRLIRCQDQRGWFNGGDHVPILTEFDLSVVAAPEIIRKNWKATDWDTFLKQMSQHDWYLPPLSNRDGVDKAVGQLVNAINEAANTSTPEIRITEHSRPGYTPEMAQLRKEARRARRRARNTDSDEDWEAFRQARHHLGRETAKLAKSLHRERVEAGAQSIDSFWKVARWARSRGEARPSFTPTLVDTMGREYQTPEDKAMLFHHPLHPDPPEADLSDMESFRYPEPLPSPKITLKEVKRAVANLAPNKAPGPDGIPNLVLQRLLPVIGDFLTNLFNDCLRLGYCPTHLRNSTTVVIRKPGKDDYTDPLSYRPIALLNTIAKALESVLASRISYLVEEHNLLPVTHIGGRRGRSCEHALHLLMEQVHVAWRDGNRVASLLTLDVKGAFNNVNHERLLHNLRKRHIPEDIVRWMASFLSDRKTIISLLEGPMGEYPLQIGIPQGSPLSPILYLFFNADLIDDLHAAFPGQLLVTGYIDDICILAWGETAAENCQLLAEAHKVAEEWERRHASRFSPSKYGLIHMHRKHRRVPQPRGSTDTPLHLESAGVVVEAKPILKYLGVWLDKHLTGQEQVRAARKKAAKLTAALSSIAGSTWGTDILQLRRMYTAVLLPQVTYASSVWYVRGGYGFKGAENEVQRAMESIQYKALYRIAGAFRTTSRAALEVCLHVPPPMITLIRTAEESCLRILSSPLKRTLHQIRASWPPDHPGKDPLTSPLHRLEYVLERRLGRGTVDRLEEIRPFVVSPWWSSPSTHIDDNREAALAAHQTALARPATLTLYTDGSGLDGGIGASVYSELGIRAVPVGSDATHTVYAAELVGVDTALDQILIHQDAFSDANPSAVIFTDNQAAIQACQDPRKSSGQYIIKHIVEKIDRLHAAGWSVTIQWIPGHEGAEGNERADDAAKEAARMAAARTRQAEPLTDRADHQSSQVLRTPRAARMEPDPRDPATDGQPILVAVCRQRLREAAKKQWKLSWETNPHGKHLRKILAAPSKAHLDLHRGLRRAASSVVVQLQTGKIALAGYLGTFGAAPTTECPCGLGRQDSDHILTSCPTYANIRSEVLWDEAREPDYRRILSQGPLVKKAAQFMLRTRLLGQFRNLPPTYRVSASDS